MKLELKINQIERVKHFSIQIFNHYGIESKYPIFHYDTNGIVHTCIKQLEPIKVEIMQFCKEIYDTNCKESKKLYDVLNQGNPIYNSSSPSRIAMDWEKQIVPLLRQHKIQNLLSQ